MKRSKFMFVNVITNVNFASSFKKIKLFSH